MALQYPLTSLYFYVDSCNLACRHCWITPTATKSEVLPGFSPDVFGAVLDDAKHLGLSNVKFTGGEPFLLVGLDRFVDAAVDRGLDLWFETNGTLVSERFLDALRTRNVLFSVSLDGDTQDLHAVLRRRASAFDEALRGAQRIVERGFDLQLILSLHRRNADALHRMPSFAADLGAKDIKVNVIMPCGHAESQDFESDILSPEETLDLYQQLESELADASVPVLFDVPPAFKSISELAKDSTNCGIKGVLSLFSSGEISVCGIGAVHESLILGRVGVDRLADIWLHDPVLGRIRQDLPAGLKKVCASCLHKHSCLGKCVASNFHLGGALEEGFYFCQSLAESGRFPKSRIFDGMERKSNGIPMNYRLHDDIVFRKETDGGILFNYKTGATEYVNASASRMLEVVEDGPTAIGALVGAVASPHPDVGHEEVKRDVETMIAKLVEEGFVVSTTST